jgi:hypothetical protein
MCVGALFDGMFDGCDCVFAFAQSEMGKTQGVSVFGSITQRNGLLERSHCFAIGTGLVEQMPQDELPRRIIWPAGDGIAITRNCSDPLTEPEQRITEECMMFG